jgi:hypothetical protein
VRKILALAICFGPSIGSVSADSFPDGRSYESVEQQVRADLRRHKVKDVDIEQEVLYRRAPVVEPPSIWCRLPIKIGVCY